jgi:hypothetical protein
MKYEYKVEVIPNADMVDYVDALNIEGDDGWELVVEYMAEGVDESVCTFKRVRTELGVVDNCCNN